MQLMKRDKPWHLFSKNALSSIVTTGKLSSLVTLLSDNYKMQNILPDIFLGGKFGITLKGYRFNSVSQNQ